jgi:glutaredoxin
VRRKQAAYSRLFFPSTRQARTGTARVAVSARRSFSGILSANGGRSFPAPPRSIPFHSSTKGATHMARTVIVYTQPTCGPCQEEKMWLTQQNIPFEDRDIRKNDAYFQEAIELGASMTPVTLIVKEDGERIVVHGFDKEQLKKALDLS